MAEWSVNEARPNPDRTFHDCETSPRPTILRPEKTNAAWRRQRPQLAGNHKTCDHQQSGPLEFRIRCSLDSTSTAESSAYRTANKSLAKPSTSASAWTTKPKPVIQTLQHTRKPEQIRIQLLHRELQFTLLRHRRTKVFLNCNCGFVQAILEFNRLDRRSCAADQKVPPQ